MNGRIYDPLLGRFLSADPFVQFPNNLQNYNRYSYALNNPLSLVDPSGYNAVPTEKELLHGIYQDITNGVAISDSSVNNFRGLYKTVDSVLDGNSILVVTYSEVDPNQPVLSEASGDESRKNSSLLLRGAQGTTLGHIDALAGIGLFASALTDSINPNGIQTKDLAAGHGAIRDAWANFAGIEQGDPQLNRLHS